MIKTYFYWFPLKYKVEIRKWKYNRKMKIFKECVAQRIQTYMFGSEYPTNSGSRSGSVQGMCFQFPSLRLFLPIVWFDALLWKSWSGSLVLRVWPCPGLSSPLCHSDSLSWCFHVFEYNFPALELHPVAF